MAQNSKTLFGNRFQILQFLLRLSGIPVNVNPVSRVYFVYDVILVMCYCSTTLSVIMDFVVNSKNLVEAMKNIRMILALSIGGWMYMYLRSYKNGIEHLLQLTEFFAWHDKQTTRNSGTEKLTKSDSVARVQTITKYVTLTATIFHGIQSAVRMILNHDMVLSKWYPFDVSVSPSYEVANLTQAIASFLMIFVFFGFQNLYATLVCVACEQLHKLKWALLNIKPTRTPTKQEPKVEIALTEEMLQNITPGEIFHNMQNRLNDCIRLHQYIKKYVQTLEDSLNVALGGVFFLLLSAMCLTAFSAITSWGDHTDVSQALTMYCLMSCCVCVFCSLGSQLSEQVESVREAAWECDWVGTPASFQRCLIFIIAMANKEFTLTAGKFVPVSNSTMMNMMNQTLSFFMFLLQLKGKNEETIESNKQ